MGRLRVVAYTRISTSKEAQMTSKTSQEIFYREYIENNPEWEFCGIYGDTMSGTKLNRPDFDRLMFKCGIEVIKNDEEFTVRKLKKETEIDLIICKSTSRFCRNMNGVALLNALKEKKVYVFFENIGKSTKDIEDEMMINMLLSIDDNYSKSLSKSARWGYVQAIEKRHQVYGGHTLYGYNCIKKNGQNYLVPISQEYVDIVNQIYNWYLEDYGFRRIADKLEELGYKSTVKKNGKYAPIGKHGVKRILTNERYMGYNQIPIREQEDFNNLGKIERKEGNYYIEKSEFITPMVSEELWHKVEEKHKGKPLTKKNKGVKGTTSKYAKYLLCANCYHSMMVAEGFKGKKLYVCSQKRKYTAKACCLPYVSEQFLDDYIENLFHTSFVADEIARKNLFLLQAKNLKIALIKTFFNTDNSEQISFLQSEIEKREQKQIELMLYSDTASNASKKAIEFLQNEINDLQNSLDKINLTVDNLKQEVFNIDKIIRELKECNLEDINAPEDLLKQIDTIRVFPNQPERTKQQLMNDVHFDYSTKFQNLVEEVFYLGTDKIKLEADEEFDLEKGFPEAEVAELLERYSRL